MTSEKSFKSTLERKSVTIFLKFYVHSYANNISSFLVKQSTVSVSVSMLH